MEGTIGEIRMFGGTFAPQGWMFCQGQNISISQYQAAYAIWGTYYGGDGIQTFGVPDMRGRVPVGFGQGPGLTSVALGAKWGNENTQLTTANLANHTHTATFAVTKAPVAPTFTSSFKVSTLPATQYLPGTSGANCIGQGNFTDSGFSSYNVNNFVNDPAPTLPLTGFTVGPFGAQGGMVTNAPAGGSQPFATMQPFLSLNYIICVEGIFPMRN